jgi:hypothetical protein
MRLQQAFLHSHPMESNPAWAQTGVTMLPRINFHRVRAQYQPAARLEQPLLVSSVSREVPNARRFQGQTCSVSCENSKKCIYMVSGSGPIKSVLEINQIERVFSHRDVRVYHINRQSFKVKSLATFYRVFLPGRTRVPSTDGDIKRIFKLTKFSSIFWNI